MRMLQIRPEQFETQLAINNLSPGDSAAEISVKIDRADGIAVLTAGEAKRIGNWFLKLSAEIIKASKQKVVEEFE